MLDDESEEQVAQSDPEELVLRELFEHPEVLEEVEERKKRKFTRSGLYVMLFGALLIALGLLLHYGTHSIESFTVGVGVIVVMVGFLRILIGLIKPFLPSHL